MNEMGEAEVRDLIECVPSFKWPSVYGLKEAGTFDTRSEVTFRNRRWFKMKLFY
jgi:hypothetical protein